VNGIGSGDLDENAAMWRDSSTALFRIIITHEPTP
jgi:hypothetical protein